MKKLIYIISICIGSLLCHGQSGHISQNNLFRVDSIKRADCFLLIYGVRNDSLYKIATLDTVEPEYEHLIYDTLRIGGLYDLDIAFPFPKKFEARIYPHVVTMYGCPGGAVGIYTDPNKGIFRNKGFDRIYISKNLKSIYVIRKDF